MATAIGAIAQEVGLVGVAAQKAVSLMKIRSCNGSIACICSITGGDKSLMVSLLREAEEAKDVISVIQIAKAISEVDLHHGSMMDFTAIKSNELGFLISPCRVFSILTENGIDAKTIISKAEYYGYHQAKAVKIFNRHPSGSFGLLAELRQLVGKGVNEVDYRFGLALVRSSLMGSPAFYEGLSWMDGSFGIPVHCCSDPDEMQGGYFHDGFAFSHEGVVAVTNIAEWKQYKKEKIEGAKVQPASFYLCYKRLKTLGVDVNFRVESIKKRALNKAVMPEDKWRSCEERGLVCSVGEFKAVLVDSASLFWRDSKVGSIQAFVGAAELYSSCTHAKVKPYVRFMKAVVVMTGKLESAVIALRALE